MRQVNIGFAKVDDLHAAGDVDADGVGDDLVVESGGEADDAAQTGMAVGHDAHLRVTIGGILHQLLQLLHTAVLDGAGVNLCRVVFCVG